MRARRRLTYRRAGVDIAAADRVIHRFQPLIRATRRPEVLPDLGQFAGLFALRRYRQPVLVASTDGAGTKVKVARVLGAHEAIGVDAVAMNVNDVLTTGAEPLFVLDYFATGRLAGSPLPAVLRGVIRACRESGCALLGGETAEMPSCYAPGDYDVAGFCVGVVERRALIDGSRVRAGDVVIGLASNGVHANGFSLVRRIISKEAMRRAPWRRWLAAPTRLYVRPVLDVLRRAPIHAMVHVTGGGLARRLPALVRRAPGLVVQWDASSWPQPAVFTRLAAEGGIGDAEMFRTFNMGIGFALACRAADARRVQQRLARHRVPSWVIGRIARRRAA